MPLVSKRTSACLTQAGRSIWKGGSAQLLELDLPSKHFSTPIICAGLLLHELLNILSTKRNRGRAHRTAPTGRNSDCTVLSSHGVGRHGNDRCRSYQALDVPVETPLEERYSRHHHCKKRPCCPSLHHQGHGKFLRISHRYPAPVRHTNHLR